MKAAVLQNPMAVEFAEKPMQKDKEIAYLCLKNPHSLRWISVLWCHDKR